MAAQAAAAGLGLDLGTIVEQVAQEKGIDKKVLIETMKRNERVLRRNLG